MDKVVHFEIPADDQARAKEFYSSIFEWEVNDADMGGGVVYTTVKTVATDETMQAKEPGAINGGMMQRQGRFTAPVVTIETDDIESTLQQVEKLGGAVVEPKMAVGEMGFAAYFSDTEGNVVGLWQNAG